MPRRDDYDRPRRPSRPRPPRKSNQGVWFLIGLIAVPLILGGCGLGIWFGLEVLFPKKPAPPVAQIDVDAFDGPQPAPAIEVELPAGAVVKLPDSIPERAPIGEDPFQERKQIFMTEWPRMKNRGPAWNINPDRLDLTKPFAAFGADVDIEPSKLPEGRYQGYVFPTSPSPFVAILAEFAKKPAAKIYDLRNGGVVGQIDGNLDLALPNDVRLSPDGKTLLVGKVDEFLVYSTDGAEKKLPAKFRSWFDFGADGGSVLMLGSDRGRSELIRINVKNGAGAVIYQAPFGSLAQGPLALSPNRKIVSLAAGEEIVFLDSSSGDVLGKRSGPALSFNKMPTCTAMAFSADGTRWVGTFGGTKSSAIVLDVATGAVVGEFPTPSEIAILVPGHALQMTPDGSGILISGQYLVDANSGAIVCDFGVERKFAKTRQGAGAILTANWNLVRREEQGADRGLDISTFDTDRYREELALHAAPNAKLLQKPVILAGKRVIAPDRMASFRPVAIAGIGRFDPPVLPAGGPIHAFAINSSSKFAAVLRATKDGEDAASRELVIDIVALEKKEPEKRLSVGLHRPADSRDFQPVFDIGIKYSAYVDPTQPAAVVVAPVQGKPFAFQLPGDAAIEWIAFSHDDTLLTVHGDGRLTAWSLPDAQAKWEMKTAAKSAAISGDRRVVAAFSGTRFDLLNASTGESLSAIGASEVATSGFRRGTASASFSSDGKSLVAAFPVGASRAIARFDLKTGKPIGDAIALPQRATGNIKAIGNRYALIGDAEVYDFQHKLSLCRLLGIEERPVVAMNSPDDRLWMIAWNSAKAMAMPPSAIAEIAKDLDDGRLKAILPKGEAVAIDVQINRSTVPGSDRPKESLEYRVGELLKSRGYTIDPNAKYKITLIATESDTGEKVELRKIRDIFETPGGTASLFQVEIRLEINGPGITHTGSHKAKNRIQVGRKFGPGIDVELTLKREVWAEAGDWAAGAVDIQHLYRDNKGRPISLPVPVRKFD